MEDWMVLRLILNMFPINSWTKRWHFRQYTLPQCFSPLQTIPIFCLYKRLLPAEEHLGEACHCCWLAETLLGIKWVTWKVDRVVRTDAVWLIETMSPSVRRISCSSECLVPTSSNTQQMVGYKCVNHFEVWMKKCKKHYFLKCAIVANSWRGLTGLWNFHFLWAKLIFLLAFPSQF